MTFLTIRLTADEATMLRDAALRAADAGDAEPLRRAAAWLTTALDESGLPVESRTNRYDDPRPVDVPDYGYRCACDDCANIRY